MFDLDRVAFSFACPECRFENSASVRQVRLGCRMICRGCKRELVLVDGNASFRQGRRRVAEQIASLGQTLKLEIKL